MGQMIRHYKLYISIIFASAAVFIDRINTHVHSGYFGSDFDQLTNTMSIVLIRILLVAIWLIVTSLPVLVVYYSDQTGGRNVLRDIRQSNRTYWECLRFYKDANPYKMNVDSLPYGDWRHTEGVILGKVDNHVICKSAFSNGGDGANFALFALPGGGKTTAQMIPTALNFGGSILAIDIKGDILRATHNHRNIKVFAPDEPSVSCHYNPLAGIEMLSLTERKSFVENMAYVLVQDEKDARYFVDGARDFFCGIALFLLAKNINTSLPDIAQAILQGNAIDWVLRIKDSDCSEAQEYTNSYFGSNEKNVSGAYGGIAKAMRPFAGGDLAELLTDNGDCLSPTTLDDGYDIYIEIPQDKIKLYSPISTIMIQNFMTAFMRRPDKSSGVKRQPVLFLLDEFPQLRFDFATLSAALSTLRSKSVSIFIAAQSIAQLINRYGDSSCREIIDTCSYISIMSAQDPQSRKFFQELLGTQKILRMTSNDDNRGAQEVREPIFQTEDFANLGDKVIIYANGKYIVAEKTYYFK